MKAIYKNFIITFLISVAIGCWATSLIVNSDNGYVAGFVFLPLLFLIGVTSFILFIAGCIGFGFNTKSAPWLLLSAVLLPVSFFISAGVAKYLELGAYYQEPVISWSDEAKNIVLFKKGTSDDQIEDFWNKTLSSKSPDGKGYESLPGIRIVMRVQPQDGHESVSFGFFPDATEKQREYVFSRVKSSPIVYQVLNKKSENKWSKGN